MRLFVLFAPGFFSACVGRYTGVVVGVADGDTVTVLDTDKTQHKVRVAGIDAPEKAQPFGQRAKERMSTLVFGKEVRLRRNCPSAEVSAEESTFTFVIVFPLTETNGCRRPSVSLRFYSLLFWRSIARCQNRIPDSINCQVVFEP